MRSNRCFGMGAGVAVVIALLAGQAVAQYTPVPLKLTYSVGLGGDNHAAEWKAGTRMLYSGGNTSPDQQLCGDVINWSVRVKAEGDHLGKIPGTETNYYRTFGAANLVFNLELRQGTADGPIVTTAPFYSTINDGTGTDPTAASAFAVSYQTLSTAYAPGRLIDTLTANGPRMEPIYTYPYYNPAEGVLIGMGCGYKEWVRSGGDLSLYSFPGIGMDVMPVSMIVNGVGSTRAGLGVVAVAEGQVDMSGLPAGTYVLKVVPGKGNNVLRGDMALLDPTNRPAFAIGVPEEQVLGGSLSFTRTGEECAAPCVGIVGRYVYYNNSKWDGNTPGIGTGDFAAIAPDKHPLLPGDGAATMANYISYDKSINGIMIDACNFNRVPDESDLYFALGNDLNDPFGWEEMAPWPNAIQVFPGAGVNGSDRLVITWADNAIPNTRWLLVAVFAGDGSLGLPIDADDFFIFGVAKGEGTGDFQVTSADEIAARNNPHTIVNKAPIDDLYDYNRDQLVTSADQIIARNNKTTIVNKLKAISW